MPHLVDVVLSCGVIAGVAAVAVPTLQASRDRDTARLAARYLATRLHIVRLEALRRNVAVAMRFDPADDDRIGVYADGDGDGVSQRDIERGIDVPLHPAVALRDYFGSVSFRIAADLPGPDGSAPLRAGGDPIGLSSGNLLSFSPLGSASSGTLYLAGARGSQVAIRVFGATGRVRVLWFDWVTGSWRDD